MIGIKINFSQNLDPRRIYSNLIDNMKNKFIVRYRKSDISLANDEKKEFMFS